LTTKNKSGGYKTSKRGVRFFEKKRKEGPRNSFAREEKGLVFSRRAQLGKREKKNKAGQKKTLCILSQEE